MLEQVTNRFSTELQLQLENATTITCCNGAATAVPTEEETRSLAERVVWSIVLILIIMASLIGNLLVVVCVRLHHGLREENANIFVMNLSVVDMTTAAVVMVGSLHAMASDKWYMGDVMCDIVCGLNYACIVVSMLTLCFISLDRYIAVVHALHYHARVTRTRVYIMVGYAWFQGLCFGLVPIMARWIHYDYWEVVCAIVWNMDRNYLMAFVLLGFNVCFVVPSVVLVVSYCKVMKVATSQNKIRPQAAKFKATASVQVSAPPVTSTTDTSTDQKELNTRDASSSQRTEVTTSLTDTPATNGHSLASNHLQDRPLVLSAQPNENHPTMTSNTQGTIPTLPNGEDLPGMVQEMHQQKYPNIWARAARHVEQQRTLKVKKTIQFITTCLPEDDANNLNKQNTDHENRIAKEIVTQVSSTQKEDQPALDVDNNVLLPSNCSDLPTTVDNNELLPSNCSDLPTTTCTSHLTRPSESELPHSPSSPSSNSPQALQASSFSPPLTAADATTKESEIQGSKPSPTECPDDPPKAREPYTSSYGLAEERSVVRQPSVSILRAVPATTKRNSSASNKVVKSMLIVIVAYFICMTPFCMTKLYKVVTPQDNMPGYINLVASVFQYCSSAINPLIYGIFRKDFQRAFLLMIRRVFRFRVLENKTNDFISATY